MCVFCGTAGGLACLRGLNQNAVSHTFAPTATVAGKSTSNTVFDVLLWNDQALGSAGASSPTKVVLP